jgi:putative two-component system hydrogenase maturation factor HypX/HoxX
MTIALLVTSFNSLTQKVFCYLRDNGHKVRVVYAIDKEQMIEEIKEVKPDIIFCPFLKKYVPSEIYENYPTFLLHPGPRGDRGAFSLENVVYHAKKEWGVVILKIDAKLDGGDIYTQERFEVKSPFKASIYRNELSDSALKAIKSFFENYDDLTPIPQENSPMHQRLTQENISIDWQKDTTDEILKKINTLDSFPGVKDEIAGVEVEIFGAWREEKLKGKPKQILAKRDGAICLGTVDGAIWISHLKEPHRFKLPATYVLKERLKGIKEDRLPLLFDKSYESFYETSVEIRDEVAYLCFNFHNGAMSASQCVRLRYCVDYLKERCKVLVLVGGRDFFSNGIHLNILEDSKKQGEDGWENINAMNDLVRSILFCDEIVTVASLAKNAGAGGVFMALACDFVVAKEGVVLNPHYKTLGLSGSEYHTYTLPKRVGEKRAKELLEACLPISADKAKEIGMVDEVFGESDYYEMLHKFCLEKYDEDFIWDKQEFLEENEAMIEAHKEEELRIMHPEFWEKDSLFHKLRREFVYKICPTKTPERFKRS